MIDGTTSTAALNDPGKEIIMEDFLIILYLYLYINVSSIYHSVWTRLTLISFMREIVTADHQEELSSHSCLIPKS